MTEIVFGLAQTLLEKLGSLAYQEVSLARGVKSDLEKLKRTMSTIKAVLLDAEEKQAKDRALSEWLEQLKDAYNDAEIVLDEFEYEALRKQVVKTYGSRKVCHLFSCSNNPLVFPFKLAHKIKDIRERFDEISANKDKFHLTERLKDMYVMHPRRRDITQYSFLYPIGRDEDRKNIIDLLMYPEDSKNNVSVIPIVGTGGLGKTTLANFVYNDVRVVSHFELRMWVCVSEDFDVPRLIKTILKSACGTINDNLPIDQLQANLRGGLKDKKFLLVLDDVCNEDRGKWSELKNLLVGGFTGSMILVTTRNNLVASIMGTINPPYTLKGLFVDACLSLFVKWAFEEGQDKQHPKLLKIGKEIVKKCKGVPLAVRILGSLLYSEVDEGRWNSIKDNEIWQIEQKKDYISPALSLSYNQMPSQLKRCFAYCSLFPKGYKFSNIYLIQFWMAHGLLPSPNVQNQELEDVGEFYIKELLSRSFFQDFEEGVSMCMFKMHDLIHDLALLVAQSECSLVSAGTKTISSKVYHLSFLDSIQEELLTNLNNVQTIMFPIDRVESFSQSFVDLCISKFKYMRVLTLSYSSFEVLSSSIGNLKHLRYLDLSFNKRIKKLPNSICNLHNLLSLILLKCEELVELPRDIRNMIKLRFLVITTKHTFLSENGVGFLSSLRILRIENCKNLKFLFEGKHHLTKLRILFVARCESLTSLSSIIKHQTALETLVIYDCKELILEDEEDNQDFKFGLINLKIRNLPKLAVLPQSLQRSVNTLQCLQIEDCTNFTALPEWLPSLKSLRKLEISECPEISSLPEGIHRLTTLRELKIEDCPKIHSVKEFINID